MKSCQSRINGDFSKGGICDLDEEFHFNELNRAFNIFITQPLYISLGYFDTVKKYVDCAKILLERSIENKQKKILVPTIFSTKEIDILRDWMTFHFKWWETQKEDINLLNSIYAGLSERYEMLKNKGKTSNADDFRALICNVLIRMGNFKDLNSFMVESDIKSKISEKNILNNVDELNTAALKYLVDNDNDIESVKQLYQFLFNAIKEHRTSGGKKQALDINDLVDSTYIYYKYFQSEVPFDFGLVYQSTLYGNITRRVKREINS